MDGFFEAALGFPTALFSFALVVVVGYWTLVLLGGLGFDGLDGGHHHVDAVDGGHGVDAHGGVLAGLRPDGVPVTVAVSLLIAIAWFVSLAGSALTTGLPARAAVLAAAVVSAWVGTKALLRPLAKLLPQERAARRHDFVGRVCVVRTGRVTGDFGQAEVAAEDGSTAVVQVRSLTDEAGLSAGRTALIFDYDPVGEHFLVAPFDPGTLGS
ncbi:DUF1449 family protein [Kitasatospora sp. CB01950]|uniref:DUF1449 family protein n=1 Tax=Kitasatospora sp. CB01950 TaxID=1703930 RepID=UPI00093E89A5|nr:DUF1449 family protein [Kitasatospora sp. CB01950]OKJ16141.1 hypothetical protein AMK19_08285 [Kitasatospora sp. CB01950]